MPYNEGTPPERQFYQMQPDAWIVHGGTHGLFLLSSLKLT